MEGSISDTWNHWLNVKHKKIWWKELYESNVVARVFTKKKEKEKITLLEGSSSTSGLECSLKGLEERLLKSMEQGFSGLNGTVETKLEIMNSRMIAIEKNQRILRKTAKKIERRLSSIESKGQEANIDDFDVGQWDDYSRGDYGGGNGSKENSENVSPNGEKETVSSEEENEAERRRVEEDAAWRRILSESENDEGKDDEEKSREPKTTPSSLSGRPKALAARKPVVILCDVWMTRAAVQVVEEETVAKTTVEEKEAVAKTTVKEEEQTVVEAETVVEDTVEEEEEAETVVETTEVEVEAVIETTEVDTEAVVSLK
ncbi:hypothetical protein N665_1203s0005 [Sinapis alba]|nr:hypothetical protein N665_1203s0005 [Sinapis alba]